MKKKELVKNLREKETKDLLKELRDSNQKIIKLEFDAKFRKLKNFHEITVERKKIARIWTIISEKAMDKALSAETKKEVGQNEAK